ncbi:unnamed protein product [Caretta caretta]
MALDVASARRELPTCERLRRVANQCSAAGSRLGTRVLLQRGAARRGVKLGHAQEVPDGFACLRFLSGIVGLMCLILAPPHQLFTAYQRPGLFLHGAARPPLVTLARSPVFTWGGLDRSVVTGASALFSAMKMGTFAPKAGVDTQVFVVPSVVLRDPPHPLLPWRRNLSPERSQQLWTIRWGAADGQLCARCFGEIHAGGWVADGERFSGTGREDATV